MAIRRKRYTATLRNTVVLLVPVAWAGCHLAEQQIDRAVKVLGQGDTHATVASLLFQAR
jgi:hypothetical protein